jgi:hypothetical protein
MSCPTTTARSQLTSATDGVVDSRTVVLNSRVAIALDVNSLTARDRSTSAASSATTSLRIAHPSSIVLVSAVTITSDNRALSVANYGGSIGMSGEGQAQCSEAKTDNEDRFEVHN